MSGPAFFGTATVFGTLRSLLRVNKATFDSSALTVARTIALPDAAGTMAMTSDCAQRVLTVAPANNHDYSGDIGTFTAGETLSQSNLVYFKSDGKVWKANSGAIATMLVMGFAVAGITSAATGTILLRGIVRDDSWSWTIGSNAVIYASGTSGALTQTVPSTTDSVVQVVGFALSATSIYFNPSPNYSIRA